MLFTGSIYLKEEAGEVRMPTVRVARVLVEEWAPLHLLPEDSETGKGR